VHLLQSAEVTGQVEDAMGYLADYLEKELVLTAKVKNALIYPALVIVLSIVVGGILIGLVFPQIAPIFAEAEFDLPVITQIFLAVGTFINAWWFAIVIFLVILGFLFAGYVRTGEGKAVVNQVIVQMPAVGEFFKKLYVARFSQITSVLVKGGIPIAQAIEISGHTVGSALYQEALHDIAEGVRRGELLSRAFERHTELFPPLVTQMVTVGEQTGKLDEMMVRVSTFYGREVDNIVGNIVELIQPALIIFIGTIVAFLFAAILLPIYSLVQVIR
jgi:type IV pilus assembly protein PilC